VTVTVCECHEWWNFKGTAAIKMAAESVEVCK